MRLLPLCAAILLALSDVQIHPAATLAGVVAGAPVLGQALGLQSIWVGPFSVSIVVEASLQVLQLPPQKPEATILRGVLPFFVVSRGKLHIDHLSI